MILSRQRNLVSLAAYLVALVALVLSLLVSLYNLDLLTRTADDVDRADRARFVLDDYVDAITDAETGQRGYLLTGDASYLEPYHTGLFQLANEEPELVASHAFLGLASDDPDLQALIASTAAKRQEMARTIDVFDELGGKAAMDLVVTDLGLKLMGDIKVRQRALKERVALRYAELRSQSEKARRFATVSTLVTGFLTILMLSLAFFTADRQDLLRRVAQARAEAYSRRLTELADVGLQLNRARDRPSLLGMASTELRRLLSVEVAAAVVREPESASAVSVGTRARALSDWRPEDEPLQVGLRAEAEGGFSAEIVDREGNLVLREPSDLQTAVAIPLFNRKGEVFGHLVAAEPVGEGMDAVAQLSLVQLAQFMSVAWENVLLLEELQQAATERESFMNMLGHELRNPLNAISGAAQVLAMRIPADDPLAELVSMLRRQSSFMRELVDDLLDVARLERGTIELDRRPVDVAHLVRRVADDFRTGRDLPAALEVEIPPRRKFVLGDPPRIAQCVTNLLDNAVKFGEGQPVVLRVRREGHEVRVSVRDRGTGLDADQIERIFERYAQIEGPARRDGLGLGLSLVEGLMQLHGGRVEVESEGLGKGATFSLVFPLLEDHVEAEPEVDAPARPRSVLVVDDREDARLALQGLLEGDGHEVITATNGREALVRAGVEGLSVVFCDISMGDGPDGYEVARTLRSRPELAHLKLVALTGFGTHLARERSLEAGFDVHLTKPVDLDVLRRTLRTLDT